MRDRMAIGLFKRLIAWLWTASLRLGRALRRLRERPRWKLAGGCMGCGRCCQEPAIHVVRAFWRLPAPARQLFLAWQHRVNGLELLSEDRENGVLAFRCSHFDPARHACDSYATRPAMCRDYPRVLLDQAWPELFPECGFRIRSRQAAAMGARIDGLALPEEKKRELRQKLRLD